MFYGQNLEAEGTGVSFVSDDGSYVHGRYGAAGICSGGGGDCFGAVRCFA